jgi:hydroxymethylbilane synthase
VMVSAAGQGALGIEIRKGDTRMREILAFLNDPDARAATICERALLNKLGGGCQVPIGAYAEVKNGTVFLTAVCAHPDGSQLLKEEASGTDPVEVGDRAGDILLRRGADKILEEVYGAGIAAPQQP